MNELVIEQSKKVNKKYTLLEDFFFFWVSAEDNEKE